MSRHIDRARSDALCVRIAREHDVREARRALDVAEHEDRRAQQRAAVAREFAAPEYPKHFWDGKTCHVPSARLAELREASAAADAALAEWSGGEAAWIEARVAELRAEAARAEDAAREDPRFDAWSALHAQQWCDERERWAPVGAWAKDEALWPLLSDTQRATMARVHMFGIQAVVCAIDGRSPDRNWRPDHITAAARAVGLEEFVRRCADAPR